MANTVDPVGGSVAIEQLTDDIERGAADLLARIDASGGTLAAIERGFIQREIQDSAYRAQVAIDAGEAVVVGVNRFTKTERGRVDFRGDRSAPRLGGRRGQEIHPTPVSTTSKRRQIERVRAIRASRDAAACAAALAGVTHAAREGSNLVPPIIDAVEARATLGEIADGLRSVFGEYEETASL